MEIKEIEQNCHEIIINNKTIYLVGTAHASNISVDLVEKIITTYNPDTVCIELDETRLVTMNNSKHLEEIDIVKLIKQKKFLFFLVHLGLSAFQKNMAEKMNTILGGEFKKAVELCEGKDIKLVLIDRDADITIKRAWNSNTFFQQLKTIFKLFFSKNFEENNINDIENIKKKEMLVSLIEDMQKDFPILKKIIIDERDLYMVSNIIKNMGNVTVAVVGAGHTQGMINRLRDKSYESIVLKELEKIPQGTKGWKVLSFIFPVLIILIFIYGFFLGDRNITYEALYQWFFLNGTSTLIGSLIALGHPMTLIASFLMAPFTSLNPLIGIGLITVLVQFYFSKPRVKDFKNFNQDWKKLSKWWSNKFLKIILVFILSSLGSAIGTFLSIKYIYNIIS